MTPAFVLCSFRLSDPYIPALDPTSEALGLLDRTARKYPELPSARVLMYRILAQHKEFDAARFQLEETTNNNPHDPEPYLILGDIALHDGWVAEAAMDFEKAKSLLAAYTNAERKVALERQLMSGLALVAETRDLQEAEARLRDLVKLAPDDLPVRQRLAGALFFQARAKDAYDVLKAAKKIDRDTAERNKTQEVFPVPEAVMAQYYDQYERGMNVQTGNAEKWFKSALEHAPNDLPTRQVVADWALDNGKIAFAKEQAEAALRIEARDERSAALLHADRQVVPAFTGLPAFFAVAAAVVHAVRTDAVKQIPLSFACVMQGAVVGEDVDRHVGDVLRGQLSQFLRIAAVIGATRGQGEAQADQIGLHLSAVLGIHGRASRRQHEGNENVADLFRPFVE